MRLLVFPVLIGLILSATPCFAAMSEQERRELDAMANGVPSVSLAIQFEADAVDVRPDNLPALDALGKAMSSIEGAVFEISVFVDDATNADSRNLALRRAKRLKQYLVSKYQIDPAAFVATAFAGEKPDFCCVRVLNINVKR